MDFVEALKIAEGVMSYYKTNHPIWYRRMEGTPILNDIPCLMAEAFVAANRNERDSYADSDTQ